MLNRNLFHSFRLLSSSSSTGREEALRLALSKTVDDVVLKHPRLCEADGVNIKTMLNDGTFLEVSHDVKEKNTIVSASKDGVKVERELNWLTMQDNLTKPKAY